MPLIVILNVVPEHFLKEKKNHNNFEQSEADGLSWAVQKEVQVTRSDDQTDKVAELKDEYETASDCVSVTGGLSNNDSLYSLEKNNEFMDDTYGRSVQLNSSEQQISQCWIVQ